MEHYDSSSAVRGLIKIIYFIPSAAVTAQINNSSSSDLSPWITYLSFLQASKKYYTLFLKYDELIDCSGIVSISY